MTSISSEIRARRESHCNNMKGSNSKRNCVSTVPRRWGCVSLWRKASSTNVSFSIIFAVVNQLYHLEFKRAVSWNQWQNVSKFKLWELPMNWMKLAWITAQNIQRRNRQHSRYKRKLRRTNLKKTETDPNCSLWKLVSLTGFQRLFMLLLLFDFCYAREKNVFDTKLWFCIS